MKLKTKYFQVFGPEHNIIDIHFIQVLKIRSLNANVIKEVLLKL